MRLIGELNDGAAARTFSNFLKKEGVENRVESHDDHYSLWVEDEDRVEQVRGWYAAFQSDPTAAQFQGHERAAEAFDQRKMALSRESAEADLRVAQKAGVARKPRFGLLTLLLILLCGTLYLGGSLQSEKEGPLIFTSPLYGALLYDWPRPFELFSELHTDYSVKEISERELPPKGQKLLVEAMSAPYWQGLYVTLLKALGAPDGEQVQQGPLYGSVLKGEVWRLITPIFLHADLFHILFNMLWLIVLGNQMEFRLGRLRYLLFILIAGLVSNAAQYIVSGPAFLGFSGVILAMLGFIWMRQRQAAWEGYQLTRPTVIFILIYVLGLLALQLVNFGLEVAGKGGFPVAIANTAHITGALVGIFLGRLKLFSIKPNV